MIRKALSALFTGRQGRSSIFSSRFVSQRKKTERERKKREEIYTYIFCHVTRRAKAERKGCQDKSGAERSAGARQAGVTSHTMADPDGARLPGVFGRQLRNKRMPEIVPLAGSA